MCERQYTKKYTDRPSPPYPAQECRHDIKKGNDGRMYISESDINGIFRWKVVNRKGVVEEDVRVPYRERSRSAEREYLKDFELRKRVPAAPPPPPAAILPRTAYSQKRQDAYQVAPPRGYAPERTREEIKRVAEIIGKIAPKVVLPAPVAAAGAPAAPSGYICEGGKCRRVRFNVPSSTSSGFAPPPYGIRPKIIPPVAAELPRAVAAIPAIISNPAYQVRPPNSAYQVRPPAPRLPAAAAYAAFAIPVQAAAGVAGAAGATGAAAGAAAINLLDRLDIIRGFPSYFPDIINYMQEKNDDVHVVRGYGQHAKPLTLERALRIGLHKKFWVLSGQDIYTPYSNTEKIENLRQMEILGYGTNEDNLTGSFKPGDYIYTRETHYPDYSGSGDVFGLDPRCKNRQTGESYAGTGSGCDPVYIFSKS
jgi:hypothetical protein